MSDTNPLNAAPRLWPTEWTDTELANRLKPAFRELLQQERLNEDLLSRLDTLYLPMAAWVAGRHEQQPLMLGVNGGQGSGKSTLSKILRLLLERGFGKQVVVISIDDLYLPRAARQQLARDVHPLLATRGVPGTHDLTLALLLMDQLKQGRGFPLNIPVFDKALDDRAPEHCWQHLQEPADIILFEGWCVGARPQTRLQLIEPVNRLEAEEDADRRWRQYVNEQLAGHYQQLFAMIDILMLLKIPDMKNVYDWRLLQETKLKQSLDDNGQAAMHVMSEQQLERFIMHYERITRNTLQEMPERADVVLELDDQHQVSRVSMHGE